MRFKFELKANEIIGASDGKQWNFQGVLYIYIGVVKSIQQQRLVFVQ